MIGFGCFCYGIGYFSSSLYNAAYYWLRQLPYHYPNRYQTIFHGLAWLGLPGLILLGRDVNNMDINVQNAPRIRTINIPQFHYHHFPQQLEVVEQHQRSHQEEKKDNEKEDKKKEKKVASYESKSSIFWIMFGIGALRSYYETYKVIYQKCLTYAARTRTIIENVN